MRSVTAIMLVCIFLVVCSGCEKRAEKPAPSEEKKEAVMEEPDTGKTMLTAQDRVNLALSVRDEEVTLTGRERAKIVTNKGTFEIEFYPEDAPNTVKNFVRLARTGFYDGLTFHRYEPGFVIQGGDPLGNGTGDAGYDIDAEFNKQKHGTGAVGMARGPDPNSASCQFYVTLDAQPHLDGKYTVFGRVVEGMDVVMQLRAKDVMEKAIIE